MITEQQLAVYLKYDGYRDVWDRSGAPADWRAAFPDPHGYGEVERVLWGVSMVAHGLAAPELARRVRAEVAASAASPDAARRLWAAAAARRGRVPANEALQLTRRPAHQVSPVDILTRPRHVTARSARAPAAELGR